MLPQEKLSISIVFCVFVSLGLALDTFDFQKKVACHVLSSHADEGLTYNRPQVI